MNISDMFIRWAIEGPFGHLLVLSKLYENVCLSTWYFGKV